METYAVKPNEPTVCHGKTHHTLAGLDLMAGFRVGDSSRDKCMNVLKVVFGRYRLILLTLFRGPSTSIGLTRRWLMHFQCSLYMLAAFSDQRIYLNHGG